MTSVCTKNFASELVGGTETCGPPDFEMLPTCDTILGAFQETVLNLNTGEYNRVKKNQLDAQFIFCTFRPPVHVSGVS